MHFQISWHVFLKAKNELKAMKLLKHFENKIDQVLLNIEFKPNLKEKTLIDATFVTQYQVEMEIERVVFDVLQRVKNVSDNLFSAAFLTLALMFSEQYLV